MGGRTAPAERRAKYFVVALRLMRDPGGNEQCLRRHMLV